MRESVEITDSGIVITDKRKLGKRKTVTNLDEAAEVLSDQGIPVPEEPKEPILRIWPQTLLLCWAENVKRCTQAHFQAGQENSETSPQTTKWLTWYQPYWIEMSRPLL